MKKLPLKIENMDAALAALNDALQQALTLIYEKAAGEASVSLNINMEMYPSNIDKVWVPTISYKTSVKVPVEIRNKGVVQSQQVCWDQDAMSFVMLVEGEQMKL